MTSFLVSIATIRSTASNIWASWTSGMAARNDGREALWSVEACRGSDQRRFDHRDRHTVLGASGDVSGFHHARWHSGHCGDRPLLTLDRVQLGAVGIGA